ncbi:hypothetical protein J1614_006755 [Plenodomus biglobosus]|nr:hypothetical protein J1614_006755 [Plenodomus biglobosus]
MSAEKSKEEPFPWHLGVYDAHCHPTDTMSSLETLVNMKARVLTVMATRAEDQDLVLALADKHGIQSCDPSKWTREERILPCFGWHPWFSHQMYISDDSAPDNNNETNSPKPLTGEAKITHYQSVLQPSRPTPSAEDRATFLALPDPTPFSHFLAQTRKALHRHPYAQIGEIGLDRSFRIPEPWSTNPSEWATRDQSLTLGGRESRRLTPFRCSLQHQRKIFTLQLQLAGELGRAVSVHGVQAHGMLLESMQEVWKGCEREVLSKRERKMKQQEQHQQRHSNGIMHVDGTADTASTSTQKSNHDQHGGGRPFPPRICLHSYSGNASNFKQYLHPAIPARIFASFSTAINLSDARDAETPAAFADVVRAVPDHMLLVESDLDRAGKDIDVRLEDMVRRLCEIKGWGLEEGVVRLGRNWRAFAFGDEGD